MTVINNDLTSSSNVASHTYTKLTKESTLSEKTMLALEPCVWAWGSALRTVPRKLPNSGKENERWDAIDQPALHGCALQSCPTESSTGHWNCCKTDRWTEGDAWQTVKIFPTAVVRMCLLTDYFICCKLIQIQSDAFMTGLSLVEDKLHFWWVHLGCMKLAHGIVT